MLWVQPVVYPAGGRYPRMVQRVIGVPRDRVAIRHGQVWRNGAALNEPYCDVPFPADFEVEEAEVPAQHYLVLPDRRGGSHPGDSSPRGAGWLLGAEQVLGRVCRWPWLEPIGLLIGPIVCLLQWCWTQLGGHPQRSAPGDDEPARVHMLCDACRRRAPLLPAQKQRQGSLPPGFRWVTPIGLRAPRSPGRR